MLRIPRPTTRAECRDEARPCPWVGCRHHLLLEVAIGKPWKRGGEKRATSLRLNHESSTGGRRAGLRSSAAAALVEAWIDDALELLYGMRYSCALDVVDDFPDGLTPRQVGLLLGVTRQAIEQEERHPGLVAALQQLREAASDAT